MRTIFIGTLRAFLFVLFLVSTMANNIASAPNAASKNCIRLGGTHTIVRLYGENEGMGTGEIGICSFDRGMIEEWTLLRHMNNSEVQKAIIIYFNPIDINNNFNNFMDLPTPAIRYCYKRGGKIITTTTVDQPGALTSYCKFDDNSIIGAWTVYRGFADPPNNKLTRVLKSRPH
ncbi:MAG: DUF333 domain-containing protein [Oligoflexia bacterium]|nr:DUF333 domain-containing protein [Oligoflexia bacterium]